MVYRLRVFGVENLPETGPGLVVCNHVSYVDGILLLAASRRKIYFIIDSNFVLNGFVGWFLRQLGAVPMPRGGPKGVRAALQLSIQLLQEGKLVGIFPEGFPTRCGAMLPFHRGFEMIAKKADVPIIPACIDRMWGSIFGYYGGKLFWKRPRRSSGPVQVRFGKAMVSSCSSRQARATVQRLLADAAIERSTWLRPVHRSFVRNAARRPFRRCFVDATGSGKELSYAKALTGALCLRKLLKPVLGVEHMVGIWLPSSTGGALANLALCLLGKTAVNLNYTAGPDAIQSAIRQCQIRHVLTSKKFVAKLPLVTTEGVNSVMLEDLLPGVGRWMKLSNFVKILILPGWLLEFVLGIRKHRGDQLATVVFSSGSTGEPKGIMLTHANIAANVDAFIEHAEFSKDDRVLGILPFFHSFGYTVTLWGPLVTGASALYLPDPRAAKEVGEWSRKDRTTLMATTATFLRLYLRRCGEDDFRAMRLLVCGAEKLPVALADEFATKFGIRPLEGFGCTELSPVVSVNMADVTMAGLTQVRSKPGTVGHPLPGVACKTIHPESEEAVNDDEDGLLLVAGPNVMAGYLHRDDLTRKAMRDDWYVTGDIGRIDADGFITLTGRASRFAKIGGEMVPLERLEEELHQACAINDRLFAVTAIPDEKKGERIVVLHLPLPNDTTPKSLSVALSDRGLPNLWVPGERDFYPVENLPILGSGKLDLQKVKLLALEVTNRG